MLNIKSKETDAFYLLEDDLEAKFNNSNFWAREKVWGAVVHCAQNEPQHPWMHRVLSSSSITGLLLFVLVKLSKLNNSIFDIVILEEWSSTGISPLSFRLFQWFRQRLPSTIEKIHLDPPPLSPLHSAP
jgi:hypothetical protein